MSVSYRFLSLLLISALASLAAADEGQSERFKNRWVYPHPGFDLREDKGTQQFIELIERSKKAGYNGVFVVTHAPYVTPQPDAYFQNMERVRAAAERVDIELIPTVMKMNGWSNGILSNNPNLAPGVPVKDCVFRVQGGKAFVASRQNLLSGGDFESFTAGADKPDGWDWVDLPGKATFEDRETRHGGKMSLRFEHFETASQHGNCRMFKRLNVKPWHEYHLRLWIKTEDVQRPADIKVQVHGDVDQKSRRNLQYRTIDVKATQDWTQHDAVFNTLHNSEVFLYIGGWAPGGGKIWVDDASLREVAGINLLRRDGCPIKVTNEDGSVTYVEGQDFEKWEYPKMGRVRVAGSYEIAHPEPPLVLTKKTRIREGQTLKVSFYHTLMHQSYNVGVCLSNDEVFQILERHLETIRKAYRPKTYLMVHDEVRLAGWCECCNPPNSTSGDVLARCVKRCADTIRKLDPDATIISWSDMFDPLHNAVDNYWLTRGTMKGSWEGLDRDIMIGNWNHHRTKDSVKFFADRGHHQFLASYYDRQNWQPLVRDGLEASKGVATVDGIMYTTWNNDFRHLEEFLTFVRAETTEPRPSGQR